MTATRDIARGELIFSEKPLNRGPRMSGKPVCLGCYRVLKGGEVLCPKGTEEHHAIIYFTFPTDLILRMRMACLLAVVLGPEI